MSIRFEDIYFGVINKFLFIFVLIQKRNKKIFPKIKYQKQHYLQSL